MRAVQTLARAVRDLKVDPETMERAAALCGGPEQAQRLYREWVNDAVRAVGTPWFRTQTRDPDGNFLEWVEARAADPFHVSFQAHDGVRAAHGEETALLFSQVRWRQEVAWARRMRGSDNDRISVLAETWLTAARRDPATLFRGLADTYAEEGLADAAYAASSFHVLSEDEILEGKVDDLHWRPLWLRFADRQFGRRLNAMTRVQMGALSARVRDAEWRDRAARERTRQAAALRARRPSLVFGVIAAAVELGLSSDDLLAAEEALVRDVEEGTVSLAGHVDPPWRILMRRLGDWSGRADPPDAREAARRLEAVEGLTPSWAAGLPSEFRDRGGDSHRRLVAWFDDIARPGGRTPPADPALDYGMWLVEEQIPAGV